MVAEISSNDLGESEKIVWSKYAERIQARFCHEEGYFDRGITSTLAFE